MLKTYFKLCESKNILTITNNDEILIIFIHIKFLQAWSENLNIRFCHAFVNMVMSLIFGVI